MKLTDSQQSWQQNRLDLAEHFFATIDPTQCRCAPTVTEDIVDLLFEIGKGLLDRGCSNNAITWLERAYHLLESQDIDRLSPDAGELRLNVMCTYGWLCCPWRIAIC